MDLIMSGLRGTVRNCESFGSFELDQSDFVASSDSTCEFMVPGWASMDALDKCPEAELMDEIWSPCSLGNSAVFGAGE
jgi:hypothetical protein